MELRSDRTSAIVLVLENLLELAERVLLCMEHELMLFSDYTFFLCLKSLVILSIMKSVYKATYGDICVRLTIVDHYVEFKLS